MHSVNLLLRDVDSLRMQWKTGRSVVPLGGARAPTGGAARRDFGSTDYEKGVKNGRIAI